MTIDWSRIDPFLGSRDKAFEALCVDVFRGTVPGPHWRNDGAGGDRGVEAYAESSSGIHGIQAKYFPTGRLNGSRLGKIRDSMRSALNGFPKLRQYSVYLPIDLTVSENAKVQTAWRQLAKPGQKVRIVGAEQLEITLHRQEFGYLLDVFFAEAPLSPQLLRKRLDEEVQRVDQRYRPSLHTPTSNSTIIETRLDRSRHPLRAVARNETAKQLRQISERLLGVDIPTAKEAAQALREAQGLLTAPAMPLDPPARAALLQNIEDRIRAGLSATEEAFRVTPIDNRPPGFEIIRESLSQMYRLATELSEARSTLAGHGMIIVGAGGAGKTHAACRAATTMAAAGQPVVYVSAHGMPASSSLRDWILQRYAPGSTWETLVDGLRALGREHENRTPVIVDGLNEAADPAAAVKQTIELLLSVQDDPYVQLIVLLRPHWPLTGNLQRRGLDRADFEEAEIRGGPELLSRYFEAHDIEANLLDPRAVDLLAGQPLLLALFCEAHRGQRLDGAIEYSGLFLPRLLRRYLARLAQDHPELRDKLPPGEPANRLLAKLVSLAGKMRRQGSRTLGQEEAAQALGDGPDYGGSLLKQLVETDLLLSRDLGPDDNARVAFALDPVYEACFALDMVDQAGLSTAAMESLARPGPPAEPRRRPLLKRLASARAGRTLARMLARDHQRIPPAVPSIVAHLGLAAGTRVWRHGATRSDPDLQYKALAPLLALDTIEARDRRALRAGLSGPATRPALLGRILLEGTAAPRTWMASEVSRALAPLSLANRDLLLHDATFRLWPQIAAVLKRPWENPEDGPHRGDLLPWLLALPDRRLRDRATAVLGRVARQHPERIVELAVRSHAWGDPYIEERLLAALCHAAFWRRDQATVLAGRRVFDAWLREGAPHYTTNARIRDTASTIVSLARTVAPTLLDEEEFKAAMPPFPVSRHPPWPEDKAVSEGDIQGFHVGPMKSDFLNYTVGSQYRGRQNYRVTPEYAGGVRMLSHRVRALGWTRDAFATADQSIQYVRDRGRDADVERWGKKYAWIAFFELLGRLHDVTPFDDSVARQYDDSHRNVDPAFLATRGRQGFPNPEWPPDHGAGTMKWLRATPLDVPADVATHASEGRLLAAMLRTAKWGDASAFCRAEAYAYPSNWSQSKVVAAFQRIGSTGAVPDFHYALLVEYPHGDAWNMHASRNPPEIMPLAAHYAYESYHSEMNEDEGGRLLPCAELARLAGYSFDEQTGELFSRGRRATWTGRRDGYGPGTEGVLLSAADVFRFAESRAMKIGLWIQNERGTGKHYVQTYSWRQIGPGSWPPPVLLSTNNNLPTGTGRLRKKQRATRGGATAGPFVSEGVQFP